MGTCRQTKESKFYLLKVRIEEEMHVRFGSVSSQYSPSHLWKPRRCSACLSKLLTLNQEQIRATDKMLGAKTVRMVDTENGG